MPAACISFTTLTASFSQHQTFTAPMSRSTFGFSFRFCSSVLKMPIFCA